MSLIEVRDLKVDFGTPDGTVHAVRGINFGLQAGKTLGIVGESGSGKSQTVLSLMGLLADNGRSSGSARFEGRELIGMADRDLRGIRGNRIAMIFQDPMTSLNPYLKIGVQMAQVLELHEGMSRRQALRRCGELLEAVRIPDAGKRLHSWPHELSGGMRQRVTIATALLCTPALLIADEPTTALDVTVQAQILTLMQELRRDFNAAIIFITHDLGIVAGFCDDVLVMQDGEMQGTGQRGPGVRRPETSLHTAPAGRCAPAGPRRAAAREARCRRRSGPGCRGAGCCLFPGSPPAFRSPAEASGGNDWNLHDLARRNAGRGGRVRLRQIVSGAGCHRAGSTQRRVRDTAGRRPSGRRQKDLDGRPPQYANDLSGPPGFTEPAHDRPSDRGRTAGRLPARPVQDRARRASGPDSESRGPGGRAA